MGSVSQLNQGEMFIPHLWDCNEFRFKPHRPRIDSFNHFKKLAPLWVKLQCARSSMELKGHNLIIISLDSLLLQQDGKKCSHTNPSYSSPRLPGPCGIAAEDCDGLHQLSALRTTGHSHHVLCPRRKLGASLETQCKSVQMPPLNQVCNPGKFSKNNPLSVWLLTAGGVKSSTQYKLQASRTLSCPGRQTPLGSCGSKMS